MGRDAVRARYFSDQGDRLSDALRSRERRIRGLRGILYRLATAARRVVPSPPALISAHEDGWQSGLMRTPGKRVCRKATRVRIPAHPPAASVSALDILSKTMRALILVLLLLSPAALRAADEKVGRTD